MNGNKLINATVTVTAMAFISKMLGFIREVVLAAFYGASQVMDAFLIACMIPDLLGAVVRTGIISAFIPVYNSYLAKDERKKAERVANTVLIIIFIVLAISSIIGFIFTPVITAFLAPGFSSEAQALTVDLARIMLPILLISGIIGLLSGIQQAHNIFIYPALIYAVSNIAMIVIVFLFTAQLDIYAVAIAATTGVVLQLIIQWPGLLKCRHRFKLDIDFSQEGVKRIGLLIIPVLIGMAATHVNLFIDRSFASTLPVGSISALNYASKVNIVFIGLFVTPITTVMFPTLTQYIACGNIEAFKQRINRGIRLIAFIIIPIMFLLVAFCMPVVEILFQRGAFDSQAVQVTAFALMFFSFGILGMALLDLLNQAFYAQQDTKIPLIVTIGIVSINIALNFILINSLGHGGLALATSISISLGAFTLFYMLELRMGTIGGRHIIKSLFKISTAATIMVIMGLISYGMLKGILSSYFNIERWSVVLPLGITVCICGLVYISATFFLKCEELMLISNLLVENIEIIKGKMHLARIRFKEEF